MSPSRFWLAFGILFLLSMPMRLAWMGESLWLDEAWVANSVLEPSWGKMFRYETFSQTSPSLFLVLMRGVMSVAGPWEWSARLVPWIATACAFIVVAATLRRLTAPAAALAGTAFLLSNYWTIKYAQQAKQYGTDLLAASIAIWLMACWMADESERPRRLLAITGCFAVACSWLSLPSMFFLPALLAAVRPLRSALPVAVMAAASCAVNYFVVVLPVRTPWMISSWRSYMLNPSDPAGSLARLGFNLGNLAVPQVFPGAGVLAAGFGLAIVGGLIATRRRSWLPVLLAAPVLMAGAASFLGLYPMAVQVRMIVWALPCVAVLFGLALPQRLLSFSTVFLLCAAAIVAGQFALTRVPQRTERNREAVSAIKAGFATGDCFFVHAGMAEQFKYYSARLEWAPPCRFTSTYGTPCCPVVWPEDHRNPELFLAELAGIRAQVRGRRLWMFLPTPLPGHWSTFFRTALAAIPARMAQDGCALEWEQSFDEARVQRYRC